MLNKLNIAAVLFIASISANSHADVSMEAKRDGVIATTILVGAVAGGPIGFLAGAFSGAWLGDHIEQAAEVPGLEKDLQVSRVGLQEAQQEIVGLNLQLHFAEEKNRQYAQVVLEQLELSMMFTTGADTLTQAGSQRAAMLAQFLKDNPSISIQLDGYADPRGSEESNLRLSQARLNHVQDLLVAQGVARHRINTRAYGEQRSSAGEGDQDAYALDRVVTIQLSQPTPESSLASSP